MQYELVYEKRKSIKIKVLNDENVCVFAPFFVKKTKIEALVNSKKEWIIELQNSLKAQKFQIENFAIENNILYLGEICNTKLANKVKFENGIFYLTSYNFAEIKQKLKQEYKNLLKPILKDLIVVYCEKLSEITSKPIAVPNFKINSAQTRWGSCSHSKGGISLNFSFLLAMLKIEEIKAIVAHEVCHILQPNHSIKFYDLLIAISPKYRQLKKELSQDQKQISLQLWKWKLTKNFYNKVSLHYLSDVLKVILSKLSKMWYTL